MPAAGDLGVLIDATIAAGAVSADLNEVCLYRFTIAPGVAPEFPEG